MGKMSKEALKRRQLQRLQFMKRKYGHLENTRLGDWNVHEIIFTDQSRFRCTCVNCGKETMILPVQMGKKRYCSCVPQIGRWDLKDSKHSKQYYRLDNSVHFAWIITAPEAVLMLNELDEIKKFNKNPNNKSQFIFAFKERRILCLRHEILLPHRLAQKFINEVPQVIDWLQPYLKFRLSGMIDINQLGNQIFKEDFEKYLKKND